MNEQPQITTRILQAGETMNLIGYLCYPSDIRVTEEREGEAAVRLRVGEFTICPPEYVERCGLRRGLQGEGVGGCNRVEVTITVGYAGA